MSSAVSTPVKSEFERLFNEALQHRHAGRNKEALGILLPLSRQKPSSASVFGILGDLYWRAGRLDDAAQSFKRATELSPRSELASLGLFHTLWESGRIEVAKA